VRERRFCSRGVLLSAPSAPAARADEADEASATSCRQRSMRWVLEVAMLGGLRLSKRGFGGGYSHILKDVFAGGDATWCGGLEYDLGCLRHDISEWEYCT
jgi:hypothetical protein